MYLNALDHFVKEILHERYYIRYTDDMVIVHHDPEHLTGLIPIISSWLQRHRKLTLHSGKTKIRKLSQGIDFLGYVTLPYYRVLRTRTRRRMLRRVNRDNLASYRGLLKHCAGFELEKGLRRIISG
ncbi:MAG: reverse transcriptase domain-containing protein [Patescibacteria group bacterium]